MKLSNSKSFRRFSWVPVLAMAASAHAEGDWLRHFRIGASFGLNVSTDFKTSGTFPGSGSAPGAAVAGIDHFYDDGFVRGDATGNRQNLTTFCGYKERSQRNDAAKTLTFHATRSFSACGCDEVNGNPVSFDRGCG